MASKRSKFSRPDTEKKPSLVGEQSQWEIPADPLMRSTRDVGIQVCMITEKSCSTLAAFLWLLLAALLTTLLFPVVVDHYRHLAELLSPLRSGFRVSPDVIDSIGMDGVVLFKKHDRNDDDYLSIEEFEPLSHRLMDINETYFYDQAINEMDEVFTVELNFEPLRLDSMTKDNASSAKLDPLAGLKSWKEPQVKWKNFGAGQFHAFLPQDPSVVNRLGEVYWLVEQPQGMEGGPPLSGNRYNPPMLSEEAEIMIHRLLAMVHPRPFVLSRFAPYGSVACIRAYNDRFVHIIFRIHAEYQLNEPPFYPFWFTPAQFRGSVILEKSSHKLLFFNMQVPNKQRLNVDMEWLHTKQDDAEMEVDIGYLPMLEWSATRSSLPASYGGHDVREVHIETTSDYLASIEAIQWTAQISEEQARRNLEVALYPFKEVPYYNLSEAFHVAGEEKKLVHSILLWGALDDQSC